MFGKLEFAPISMERKEEYLALFELCGEKASDYSFITTWGWSESWRYEWAFSDGFCWPRAASGDKLVYLAPVGDWNRADWPELIGGLFEPGTVFERVPQMLADMWAEQFGDRVRLEEQRSEWEYLHSYESMVTLSGNKMYKKKNRLSRFTTLYDYVYEPVTPESLEVIREMQREWCRERECEDLPELIAENRAIDRVLEQWKNLPRISGGLIFVDGKAIAYTIAEDLGNGVLIIHYEKGMHTYTGVYQAINQIFLANTSGIEIVNRQQDMGFPGMRQAKESYNPIGYLKKYRVHWLG